MIFNSFKYSGISNSLDGSEDDQFRGYEDIDKKKWDYSNLAWILCNKQWFRLIISFTRF